MWSSSPVWARPVRILARSCLSASTDFCIFCSVVLRISAMFIAAAPLRVSADPRSDVHQRALVLSEDDALERAGLHDVEHLDGQLLVATERESGRVHDLQLAIQCFVEREAAVARGR